MPMSLKTKGRRLFNLLLDTLLPRHCGVCDGYLTSNERGICTSCMQSLPHTNQNNVTDNSTSRLFWGKVEIERGYSLLFYKRETESQHIFGQMKYRGRTDLCLQMGTTLAIKAKKLGLFEEIDVIVPVPLHKKRIATRGYNQSERIALGISQITNIPIDTGIIARTRYTESQATLNVRQRETNVKGAFTANEERARRYHHILVVDDTITTGNTSLEVLKELHRAAPSCLLSICSIGLVSSQPTITALKP